MCCSRWRARPQAAAACEEGAGLLKVDVEFDVDVAGRKRRPLLLSAAACDWNSKISHKVWVPAKGMAVQVSASWWRTTSGNRAVHVPSMENRDVSL